jgi:hypothetical protein
MLMIELISQIRDLWAQLDNATDPKARAVIHSEIQTKERYIKRLPSGQEAVDYLRGIRQSGWD